MLSFQQDSEPRDTIELLHCSTPDLNAPDMWPSNWHGTVNAVDYAIWSVMQQRTCTYHHIDEPRQRVITAWCAAALTPLISGDVDRQLVSTMKVDILNVTRLTQPTRLVAWRSGRTLVFDRWIFPVLRSTCSWLVTTYVGKLSDAGQPTRPTQPFILSE